MDPSLLPRARWWSWRRQRLDRSYRSPGEALGAVIGVYSSNPSGPLSLLARVRGLRPKAVRGLVAQRLAVRLPTMRGSIYLLPVDTAHLVFSATRIMGNAYAWLLRGSGVGQAEYRRLRRRSSA